MTIYEINQQGYSKLPKMTQAEVDQAIQEVLLPYLQKDARYFMLLNNDLRDYTVFHLRKCLAWGFDQLAKQIVQLAGSRGTLKGIEANDNGVEFWVTNKDGDTHMFLLFDYDWGVINVG